VVITYPARPAVAIESLEAMEKADCRNDETIREILRLELEIAARCSSRKGNQPAANFLSEFAEKTKGVDLATLHAYSQLLDDFTASEVSSDYLREIGARQFPAFSASASSNTAMMNRVAPPLRSGDLVRVRSGGPLMTVAAIQGDQVNCSWTDWNGQLRSGSFPTTLLTPVTVPLEDPEPFHRSQQVETGLPSR
jgi:uncharacterized protein YodC (DUF2158 family)